MTEIKLDHLSLKGFKSIKELDIKLSNLNIFIGANAAGKSNFINFFKLLNALVEQRFQLFVRLEPDRLLFCGRKTTPEIKAKMVFGEFTYFFTLSSSDNTMMIFDEKVTLEEKPLYHGPILREAHVGQVYNGSTQNDTVNVLYGDVIPRIGLFDHCLKNIGVYHFLDTGDSSPMKRGCDIHDNRSLHADGSNIAAYLYSLKIKHPQHFNKIVSTIQLVNPCFDRFILEPLKLNEDRILLEWYDKNVDKPFSPYALSDGTLRFICLATLLLQPKPPKTIVIDEPELGLHPYAISVLAAMIRKASLSSQVIISTQSVTLLEEFNPEDIVVVDKRGNESQFKRLDSEELSQWLEDFSIGELWEKKPSWWEALDDEVWFHPFRRPNRRNSPKNPNKDQYYIICENPLQ